ncbi:MAG: hypothetical protein WBA13_09685 [Microcoleaceae cyanobacterium]
MEPITATAIITLLSTKFIEKATDKLSEGGVQKLNDLRQLIWQKVRGQAKVENALKQVEQGSESELDVQPVAAFLETVMTRSPEFAQQVQTLAQEINQEINIDMPNAKGVQNVFGGEAYQSIKNQGPTFHGSNHTITFN